jgi:hypothetical protein
MTDTELQRGVPFWNRYLSSLSRYDLVLTLIPSTLPISLLLAQLLGASYRIAFLGWAVVGLLALVDALFVHPPTTGRRAN